MIEKRLNICSGIWINPVVFLRVSNGVMEYTHLPYFVELAYTVGR